MKDVPASEALTTREPGSEASPGRGPPAVQRIGSVLLGRYRIDELIAEGGMGAVYLGEHLHMRKRVAIKVLHPEIDNYAETVARFEREAIAGAHISHPNVVVATDFDELPDGTCFLILEYVRGVTLHEILRHGPLPAARAVHIARQIAAALGAAHEMGILHRDVKPRNVMLVEEGRGSLSGEVVVDARRPKHDLVKLIDFGLCKVPLERISTTGAETRRHAALTAQGVVFGTPPYMAPETALGMDSVDERADLYALGIILYRMLAGKHPFDATTETEHLLANRMQQPPPIKVRSPGVDVPNELEEVVMRLLKKDVRARHESGAALIAALDHAMPHASAEAEWVPWTKPLPMSVAGAPSIPPPDDEEELPTSPTDLSPRVPSDHPSARPPTRIESAPPPAGPQAPSRSRGFIVAGTAGGPRQRSFARIPTGLAALGVVIVAAAVGALAARSDPAEQGPRTWNTVSAAPVASEPVAPSASSPLPAPLDIDGKDAAAWRRSLLSSVAAKDWTEGANALFALANLEPEAFSQPAVVSAAADVATRIEAAGDERADRVFEVLVTRLGPAGLDVLYEIVRLRGGSKGAERAGALLRRADILDRASPALRVALDLRDTPCKEKAELFQRAALVGDDRALEVLELLRAPDCRPRDGQCCFHGSAALDATVRELKARRSSSPDR